MEKDRFTWVASMLKDMSPEALIALVSLAALVVAALAIKEMSKVSRRVRDNDDKA